MTTTEACFRLKMPLLWLLDVKQSQHLTQSVNIV